MNKNSSKNKPRNIYDGSTEPLEDPLKIDFPSISYYDSLGEPLPMEALASSDHSIEAEKETLNSDDSPKTKRAKVLLSFLKPLPIEALGGRQLPSLDDNIGAAIEIVNIDDSPKTKRPKVLHSFLKLLPIEALRGGQLPSLDDSIGAERDIVNIDNSPNIKCPKVLDYNSLDKPFPIEALGGGQLPSLDDSIGAEREIVNIDDSPNIKCPKVLHYNYLLKPLPIEALRGEQLPSLDDSIGAEIVNLDDSPKIKCPKILRYDSFVKPLPIEALRGEQLPSLDDNIGAKKEIVNIDDSPKIKCPKILHYDSLDKTLPIEALGGGQLPSLDDSIGAEREIVSIDDSPNIKCPKILECFSLTKPSFNQAHCEKSSLSLEHNTSVNQNALDNLPSNNTSYSNQVVKPDSSSSSSFSSKSVPISYGQQSCESNDSSSTSDSPEERSSLKILSIYNQTKRKFSTKKVRTERKKPLPLWIPIPFVSTDMDGNYVCRFNNCGHKADKRFQIIHHMENKHEPNFIICCHTLFPTKMHFDSHKQSFHENGQFYCKISDCNRKFRNKNLLHRHEDSKDHSPEQIPALICCVCYKLLPKPQDDLPAILAHARSHSYLLDK